MNVCRIVFGVHFPEHLAIIAVYVRVTPLHVTRKVTQNTVFAIHVIVKG